MIKPEDIERKIFKKIAVGYSPEEVDEFLDEITVDLESLLKENAELKEKAQTMSQDMERYHTLETTLQNTLVMAQKAADDAKEAAKAEVEVMEREARMRVDEILKDAKTRLFSIEQEISKLESRYELMRTRVKLLLYAEIELIDKNDIFTEKDEKRLSDKEKITEKLAAERSSQDAG